MTGNYINGDGNNLAVNSPGATQSNSVVPRGQLSSLLKAAGDAGLTPADVEELKRAILQDAAEAGATPEVPGPRVQSFMARLALGAGSVTGKVGIGAAGATVAALIKAYFGL